MVRGKMLTDDERAYIVAQLNLQKTTLVISKALGRDHRTVKRFVEEGKLHRKKHVSGRPSKISARDMRRIKRATAKNPHATSKTVFQAAGVTDVSKSTRNRVLRTVANQRKRAIQPPMSKVNRKKRVAWAEQYLKEDFKKVLWTDESRATLDGPDGWDRGWLLSTSQPQIRLRRQQGGGGVMVWAGIIGSEVVGPFRVREGVKLNSESYCTFLKENLLPWLKSKNKRFRSTIMLQQDNAPSHASRYSKAWLEQQGFSDKKLMDWPPQSPDLSPIENYWSILKQKVYENGRQFSSKDQLWKAILDAKEEIEPEQVANLVSSMDRRLLEVIRRDGAHIGY
jgi:transposase